MNKETFKQEYETPLESVLAGLAMLVLMVIGPVFFTVLLETLVPLSN